MLVYADDGKNGELLFERRERLKETVILKEDAFGVLDNALAKIENEALRIELRSLIDRVVKWSNLEAMQKQFI